MNRLQGFGAGSFLSRTGFWSGLALAVALSACDKGKGEEREGNEGKQATGTGTTTDNPCLALQSTDTGTGTATGTGTGTTTASTDSGTGTSTGTTLPSTGSAGCTPPTTGGGTPTGPGGGWTQGPGLEGCEAQGKAWVAAVNGGPGQCTDPLAAFCCTEAEIMKQFPLYAVALQEKFNGYKGQQLKLYHCSTDASGSTRFHWGAFQANRMNYAATWTPPGTSQAGAPATGCPKVTSADLGIPTGGGTGSGTSTGTGTGTGTTTGGATVPATIGPLLSTTKPDLLSRLTEGAYRDSSDWQHLSVHSTADTEHGKIKIHYSGNLKDSMAAFSVSHSQGSVAIGELLGPDGTTPKGFVIMGKGTAGTGSETWFFYEIKGGPAATDYPAEPSAYGMGAPERCVTCHKTSTKDHIKSTP